MTNKKSMNFAASYLARLAVLTAMSFVLYLYVKFPLPFMFPVFLDMQFSELPALLAGFSMGPLAGGIVIVAKCLLKFPFSGTMFVGELTDIIIGLALVLPASFIYKRKKNRSHAFYGLAAGVIIATLASVLLNYFVSVPFYVELYFGGNWTGLLKMCSVLYPNATRENFFAYYLTLAVVPFNILRGVLTAFLTFLTYKRLSKLLHWEGTKLIRVPVADPKKCVFTSNSIADTYYLADKLAKTLKGGEIVILDGELGAGKTTFTKGLAKALKIDDKGVTSPTFTIMKSYEGALKLYHFDMYRLENAEDMSELGLEEFLNAENSVCVIEWNKYSDLQNVINVRIEKSGENMRTFTIEEQ